MTSTAKFFNSVAAGYDERPNRPDNAKLQHIIDFAKVHRGDTVLDVGTGTGTLLPLLAKAIGPFGNIDAVDIASEMLAVAHDKHAGLPLPVRFMLTDIEKDSVHSLYDRVILLDVLPHLEQPMETIMRLYYHNLAGAGSVTLAQSCGRDAANAANAELGIHAHQLPPAQEMATRLTDAGIPVEYVEDTPEQWLIRIVRH